MHTMPPAQVNTWVLSNDILTAFKEGSTICRLEMYLHSQQSQSQFCWELSETVLQKTHEEC